MNTVRLHSKAGPIVLNILGLLGILGPFSLSHAMSENWGPTSLQPGTEAAVIVSTPSALGMARTTVRLPAPTPVAPVSPASNLPMPPPPPSSKPCPDCPSASYKSPGSVVQEMGRRLNEKAPPKTTNAPDVGQAGRLIPLGSRVASFYGTGSKVASGQRFDSRGMTAAHRTLPFGTILKVCRNEPGQSHCVDVCVNDRGPFIHGRELDLATGAYEQLAGPQATPVEKMELRGKGILTLKMFIVSRPPRISERDRERRKFLENEQARKICEPYVQARGSNRPVASN